ncbi:calcium uptake protein 3, mitochondrial-like isoform X2 [Liolophura sinensis]|uniref:calcium uptake protein 3, mitochondrial-like isoform X2 n=1 Tax=Liolophura sinensis TaxID=3198878 RepID=UPI003158633C
MTPQDFLESVTEQIPRPRIGRVKLSSKDVESMLKSTPPRSRGSGKLFRRILDKGIISYTEYLFLLCVLTKPQSGFKIAFNMFDTDGNQIVDKREFLVIQQLQAGLPLKKLFGLSHDKKNKQVVSSRNELKPLKDLVSLEEVFSSASGRTNSEDKMSADQQAAERTVTDTTLLVHFFGQKGKEVLRFEDFRLFMENLQSEVLELEFKEFSKGMPTISEVDFARILLRYTLLDRSEINECVERVRERVPHEKGITFKEFKQFCTFLNNLDDFAITMNMYALAGKPISQEDFQRAVKVCTGYTLEPHIVRTVFIIFDEDGDGHLSHHEFISIMKDRLHRGSRSYLMHSQSRWEAFRSCVKNEMKSN